MYGTSKPMDMPGAYCREREQRRCAWNGSGKLLQSEIRTDGGTDGRINGMKRRLI